MCHGETSQVVKCLAKGYTAHDRYWVLYHDHREKLAASCLQQVRHTRRNQMRLRGSVYFCTSRSGRYEDRHDRSQKIQR